jgi:sigma-B regulation protein RsbU (phosphoserine phosphatase)
MRVDQYVTVAYAEIDLETGRVLLTQAGHPHPQVLRRDGQVDRLGEGGLPVGLIGDAGYDRVETVLHPGDRLFLMSDGVTECPSPEGVELGDEGLRAFLIRNRALGDSAMLEALIWDLAAYAGTDEFPDDVSGVLFRFDGREAP